jgi:hypothetical protein
MNDIEYDLRIGETKFREWMSQGLMPQPWITDGGAIRWRTIELDVAIDEFPDRAALAAEIKVQTARMKAQTAVPRHRSRRCLWSIHGTPRERREWLVQSSVRRKRTPATSGP